jgi:hypothetical protein
MPEVPLEQSQEEIAHHAHGATEPWIMGVALTAAILAACAAINALVSEHYAIEAMIEQIQCSDQWNFYQAKGIKAAVLTTKIDLRRELGKEVDAKDLDHLKRYGKEQEKINADATELQQASAAHLKRHEAMAPGVTMFQLAIAVAAVSVLTRLKAFWFLAIGFGIVGILFYANGVLLWIG